MVESERAGVQTDETSEYKTVRYWMKELGCTQQFKAKAILDRAVQAELADKKKERRLCPDGRVREVACYRLDVKKLRKSLKSG